MPFKNRKLLINYCVAFAKDDDLPVLHNKLHEYYGIVFNRRNLLHRLRQP
nr:MAG TPA: hypothetical protein [Caudoviricetes sp.]